MPRGTNSDPNQHIVKAVAAMDAQIAQWQAKRDQLAALIGGGKKTKAAAGASKPKRAMSEEAKQKIREAQQKRWAEAKAKGGAKKKK